MRTISQIIDDAGGPTKIASGLELHGLGELSTSAIHKWKRNGILDRYWPVLIELAGATAEELFQANEQLRGLTPAGPTPEAAA